MEVLGTFILAFFYLIQTEKKTMYSKEPALNCFIIAAAYVTARAMCDGNHVIRCGAVLNPAIGFGAQMT